jgi:hypothetical protein
VAELNHGLDDRAGFDAATKTGHKRLVNLYSIDRYAVEMAQRRVAGAEIVERHAQSRRAQRA